MFKVPLMKNALLNEEATKRKLCDFIMNTSKLSMGEMCEEFEYRFAKFQGSKYAILLNSGGSANLALLQALKNLGYLHDGDKIGFSTLTWSTNVMPIVELGMVPIPIDVDKDTMNVMSWNLEETLKQHDLAAFFTTNVLGFAGDLDIIKKICNEKKILFLEDNCESLGTEINGIKTGRFGFASTFSFFVAHHMSTIEGGMVCTDDFELYETLKIVRANGWDRNLSNETKSELRRKTNINEFNARYTFYNLGFNLRPTEITGFLGCEQLSYLEENIEKRNENYSKFNEIIKNNNDLIPINYNHLTKISPFGLTIVCKDKIIRQKYLERFIFNSIEVRPIIAGNIQNQPFYSLYELQNETTPNSDFFSKCGFYCGLYPDMTNEEINLIREMLKR